MIYPQLPIYNSFFADFRGLPNPPKNIRDKICQAKKYYPADIIFYHRDADATDIQGIEQRKREIFSKTTDHDKVVCIIYTLHNPH